MVEPKIYWDRVWLVVGTLAAIAGVVAYNHLTPLTPHQPLEWVALNFGTLIGLLFMAALAILSLIRLIRTGREHEK